MSATVLDVIRGPEADTLARTHLGYGYEPLVEGQEYIGIKARLKVISADENEVYPIYGNWQFALRYDPTGQDVDPEGMASKWKEGYPPLEADGWVFFRIREGSQPLLYFQPDKFLSAYTEARTEGAYFSLAAP